MLDRRGLEYFLALTVHGSFSGAAKALGVSQPTLSQAIARLEASSGVRLVERRRRGIEVTAAGLQLIAPARAAAEALREADHALDPESRLRLERLDIACPPTFSQDPVARLVGGFAREHPGVEYRLQEPGADRFASSMVRDRHAELAVTTHPDMDERMAVVPLMRQRIVAVVAADTDLGDGEQTVAELAAMGLLTSREGGLMRRFLEDRIGRDAVRRSAVLETTHNAVLIPAAAEGAGVAFVPERVAVGAQQIGVQVVHPADPLEREVYLLHRHEPLSPVAEAFVEFAPGALT